MIPEKIEERFIQLTIDFSGIIKEVTYGKFALQEFNVNHSIFETCPFLESTIDAIPSNETFHIDSMVISSKKSEFNIDVELFKTEDAISVLIINRTNVYKYVKQLNQNRNELSIIKNKIDRQNNELEELRKIADKANEEKSRFLAMMSHEVRNPLNSILGYANIIASDSECPTANSYIQSLLVAGNNLKVIVNDILDLSRIEAGKLQLLLEPMSIKESVQNCANDFKHLHKDKEVQLNCLVSNDLPEKVLGDSVRINQILSNLISNSFKFTKQGYISLEVSMASQENLNAIINFKIIDTGRGMNANQIKTIFNEYEQNELNDNRVHGGAGLGLSIVKRLVEAMNGKISVESELNVGTTFLLELPFQITNDSKYSQPINLKTNESVFNLNGIELLLADDDELNQVVASHLLSKEGVQVTMVNDGLEALEQLKNHKFDIVLLDIFMPNMSGEELMNDQELFVKHNSKTPILAITANTSKDDVKRYLKLGFSSVISKPYTSDELITAIGSTLPK